MLAIKARDHFKILHISPIGKEKEEKDTMK